MLVWGLIGMVIWMVAGRAELDCELDYGLDCDWMVDWDWDGVLGCLIWVVFIEILCRKHERNRRNEGIKGEEKKRSERNGGKIKVNEWIKKRC